MKKNQPGFSLLELLIVIALFSLLLTIAVPGFSQHVDKQAAINTVKKLNAAVSSARQFAITRKTSTVICTPDPNNTNQCAENNDWSSGLIVFSDGNQDLMVTPGINGEQLIQQIYFDTKRGVVSVNQSHYIRFNHYGHTTSVRSFSYCPSSAKIIYSRKMTLSMTGRTKQQNNKPRC